jgi:hypothetical protein
MQDNFDLKKYLRHGNKLLNENIGGYVDLRPINGLNEAPMGDDMVTIELDMSWEPQFDAYAKQSFDDFNIQVKETDNPGTFEVTGRKEDILGYLRSEFYEMDEESIQQYYPELLDGEMSEGEPEGDQYDGEYDSKFGPAITNELEKPKNIYADDEDRLGSLGASDDRMMDLGGDQIEQGIISLLDDGFEPEDILDACKMLIATHSQGKNF